jgi:hypothetical protein
MDNHTYGVIIEREAPRVGRPSRSTTRFRASYNEDLIAPSIGDEGDDGEAHWLMACKYSPLGTPRGRYDEHSRRSSLNSETKVESNQ